MPVSCVARWVSVVWLAGVLLMPFVGAETRYADIFYLDDAKQPELQLKVVRRAPVSLVRSMSQDSAYLSPGQKVLVLGIGEKALLVSVRAATGLVTGWVEANAVEPVPANVMEQLAKRRKRLAQQKELIASHEIAPGMSRDDVLASLGPPDKKEKAGKTERWFYVSGRYIPKRQSDGTVTYQRVASGSRVVTFVDDEVTTDSSDTAGK